MTHITKQRFVDILLQLRGATFITITTTTDARAKKTNNPHGTILKTSTHNVQVNFHYDNAVINRLAKEGKEPTAYSPGESWHTPYTPNGTLTPLATKKGETTPHYLRVRHLSTTGNTLYTTTDGTELSHEQVAPFLPKPSQYANQGTTNPVVFLTYALDTIKIASINGTTYTIN